MASDYYAPCKELALCREIDRLYWETDPQKWFAGYLPLAEAGYPLAECQIGYCYGEGLGVDRDPEKALFWTRRAAEHGDRDGQYNLGCFYEEGTAVERDLAQALRWFREAARQGHDLAMEKCRELDAGLRCGAGESGN